MVCHLSVEILVGKALSVYIQVQSKGSYDRASDETKNVGGQALIPKNYYGKRS